MSTTKVTLRRIGVCAFEATDGHGHYTRLDGPSTLEADILSRVPHPEALPKVSDFAVPPSGERAGLRPMQLLLVALAGCSVLDILLILAKQRQDVREMVIDVEGWRVEGTPAPFSQIHLHFTAHGMVEKDKLEYAVTLGITKYCSVEATLSREVKIEWTTAIVLDDKESGSSGGRSTLP